jgi:hypothetical protein
MIVKSTRLQVDVSLYISSTVRYVFNERVNCRAIKIDSLPNRLTIVVFWLSSRSSWYIPSLRMGLSDGCMEEVIRGFIWAVGILPSGVRVLALAGRSPHCPNLLWLRLPGEDVMMPRVVCPSPSCLGGGRST